jgi:DNA-binding protein HU-beta
MTKAELVAKLAEVASIKKKQAEQVLSTLVETIQGALAANQRIVLPGLGSFSSVMKKARTGRNPRTGKAIKIAAKKAVKFSAAGFVKKGLNTPGGFKVKKAAAKAKPAKKAPAKPAKKKK